MKSQNISTSGRNMMLKRQAADIWCTRVCRVYLFLCWYPYCLKNQCGELVSKPQYCDKNGSRIWCYLALLRILKLLPYVELRRVKLKVAIENQSFMSQVNYAFLFYVFYVLNFLQAPMYQALSTAIQTGCKAAIWLSERIQHHKELLITVHTSLQFFYL